MLINSVGSGIGSAAVQLAQLAGATVIGNACSDEKLARATGARHGRTASTTAPRTSSHEVMRLTDDRGVDLVFEHVGGELFQKGLDSLGKDGRLVTCGGHAGEVVPFDIIPFFRDAEEHDRLVRLHARGGREVPRARRARGRSSRSSTRRSRSTEAREAMAMMERREHFGKIVLKPDEGSAMKRLGVDVGGTFTDLIYVDDEAGMILVHKLADDAGGPVAGDGPGHPASSTAQAGDDPAELDRSSTGRRSRRTS